MLPAGLARVGNFTKEHTDLVIGALVIGIILLIIIPLPPLALDLFLILSFTLALLILLIPLFITDALQFAAFPTLLLVVTLYRLALNISSTRLILGQAQAGNVINAFGQFVVGGSYVVGFIIFVIITVIQFVVITNGAGRVAEVAARFTLDAMPGKQMSIDGDYNAGLITEEEARARRKRLQRETDFFGAMDGATKFIRGDAIAGIVIVLVNIIGGLVIGIAVHNMDLMTALQTYTILTIGDGLVSQIPAVLVATATGVLVTRANPDASFGKDISRQFLTFPRLLFIVAAILLIMGFIPAMPNLLFLTMGGILGYFGYMLTREEKRREISRAEEAAARKAPESREPENVLAYLQVDPLEIEIGYNLVPLANEEQGGDLLHRVAALRRQCAQELGIFVRPIRIRDNLQLQPNGYVFKLRGVEAASGEVMPGHYLALDPTGQGQIKGIPTTEPTFGLQAWWITAAQKEEAELQGFTVVDPSTVLVTHLNEFIKQHAAELTGRQEVSEMLETVKEKHPAVVEELVPNLLSLGEVQKVLQNLLKERVPIRDLVTILEAVADAARVNRETDYLTESARQALSRSITRMYAGADNKVQVITLHPKWEHVISDSLQQTSVGVYPALEPQVMQALIKRLGTAIEKVAQKGLSPVVVCSSKIRLALRRLTERYYPHLAVLALQEIDPQTEIEALGTVMWDED
ncbi:MAG: flagellar biosynthesis protein FlhA [Peptococcaceae bacterium]|nr:flagellar biosynthesis protein FlhA [Peptococcaceae bacterium]